MIMMNNVVLVIGLGSMGKRRIRNLQSLGIKNIIGFDQKNERMIEASKSYGIKTVKTLSDIITLNVSVALICTPPDLHLKYVKLLLSKKIHIFMELNLISEHVRKIISLTKNKKIKVLPSCTMKFHPIVKELKKILKNESLGTPLMIEHHSGFYLPYWHPWEDYKLFFASKKSTGGAKELFPVDLIWLEDIFGNIKSINATVKKISKLDVNINDIYMASIEFSNGIICNYTTDVFSKPPFKHTKIIFENGQVFCDFHKGIIKIKKDKKSKILKIKLNKVATGYVGTTPPESLYEEELENFFGSLKDKKYPFSLKHELKLLKILDAAEKSSQTGQKINLRTR